MGKKQKFIYWLIGVGCGMVLSGMAMTFVGLSLSKEEPTKSLDMVPIYEIEDTNVIKQEVKSEALVEEEGAIKSEASTYKWVQIPLNYNATQISKLLEDKEIIEDQKAFLEYLRKNKQTTKLRCGNQYLPIKGEYDTILSILTGKSQNPN